MKCKLKRLPKGGGVRWWEGSYGPVFMHALFSPFPSFLHLYFFESRKEVQNQCLKTMEYCDMLLPWEAQHSYSVSDFFFILLRWGGGGWLFLMGIRRMGLVETMVGDRTFRFPKRYITWVIIVVIMCLG